MIDEHDPHVNAPPACKGVGENRRHQPGSAVAVAKNSVFMRD